MFKKCFSYLTGLKQWSASTTPGKNTFFESYSGDLNAALVESGLDGRIRMAE